MPLFCECHVVVVVGVVSMFLCVGPVELGAWAHEYWAPLYFQSFPTTFDPPLGGSRNYRRQLSVNKFVAVSHAAKLYVAYCIEQVHHIKEQMCCEKRKERPDLILILLGVIVSIRLRRVVT
jgi:hypothetical protein